MVETTLIFLLSMMNFVLAFYAGIEVRRNQNILKEAHDLLEQSKAYLKAQILYKEVEDKLDE